MVFCANRNNIKDTQSSKIRVINRTNESFSNVVLYSMDFEDLKPGDTSVYKILDYDPLKDDPLIYCSIGDINFARYLEIPSENIRNFSYLIDSVQNGILYVSSVEEHL
tara:strand:+ start:2726 stop:3049 length:324 start_codon:yes stop_codon:yes gene_type:complete